MENSIVEAATLGGSVASLDFSIWSLFMRADVVVKGVVVLLLVASVWCWAIIFEKMLGLRKLNALASKFEQSFWSGASLDDLYDRLGDAPQDPMSTIFVAAMREWRRATAKGFSGNGGDGGMGGLGGLGNRVERVMQIAVAREMDRVERYMTFLASTGSTAPFIGLFGTVWGIINRDRKSVV